MSATHSQQTIAQGIHIIHAFEFANAVARNAATGLTADDNGKVAKQLDDKSFWVLQDFSGPTWASLTGSNDTLFQRMEVAGVTSTSDLAPTQSISNPNTGVSSQIVYFKAKVVAFAVPPGMPPAMIDTACWLVEGVIVREVGTDTVLFPVPTITTPLYNPNPADWGVIATADNVGKLLKLTASVDGFGAGPATAPPADFFAQVELVPAGIPL